MSAALLRDIVQDLRVSARGLLRHAGSTVAATFVLACGIGLSVAILSVADVVLGRSLPVADEARLVAVWGDAAGSLRTLPLTPAHFERYRHEARALVDVAGSVGLGAWPQAVTSSDRTFRAGLAPVTGNFFAVLGSHAQLGRVLTTEDDRAGAAPVAVISDALWRGTFASDPAVIGRRVGLTNAKVFTIVGVAPAGLDFPAATEIWIPFSSFAVPEVTPIGRLRPGASPDDAAAELRASFEREPAGHGRHLAARAVSFRTLVLGDLGPTVLLLTVGAALLLLTACLNVCSMLLVRGAARRHDIAVRRALGAKRSRIVRQLLVEHAPVAIGAACGGVWLASELLRLLLALAPPDTPRLDEVRIEGVSLALAALVSCVAALGAGLLPAWWLSGNVASSLQGATRTSTPTRRASRLHRSIVVFQVAAAVVVLFAAGLLGRSLARLQAIPLGLAADDLAVVELSWPQASFSSPAPVTAFYDRLLPALTALPDVVSVAPVNVVPFTGATGGWDGRFVADGQPEVSPMLSLAVVGARYFETTGIAIRRGRAFQDLDRQGSALVAVVSERVADVLWPGQDPIGKRMRFGDPGAEWRTVVGVASETRYRALREATPTVYLPLRQFPEVMPLIGTLIVRTRGVPAAAAAGVRNVVRETDPEVAVLETSSMRDLLARQLATARLTAMLVGVFGAGALVLVAVGLYAVLAGAVNERRRELAIRHAVGATPGQLRDIVLAQSLGLTATGLALGLGLALAAGRIVQALLYDLSARDLGTAGAVCAVLAGVTLVASYLPARRATRADGVELLRQE